MIEKPKSTKEAYGMVKRAWLFLLKKNPVVFVPLTLYMLFGGGIFLYKYVDADKFVVNELQPPVETTDTSNYNMEKSAPDFKHRDKPILFDNKEWGKEDTTLVVKSVKGKSTMLVYDKVTKKTFELPIPSKIRK